MHAHFVFRGCGAVVRVTWHCRKVWTAWPCAGCMQTENTGQKLPTTAGVLKGTCTSRCSAPAAVGTEVLGAAAGVPVSAAEASGELAAGTAVLLGMPEVVAAGAVLVLGAALVVVVIAAELSVGLAVGVSVLGAGGGGLSA